MLTQESMRIRNGFVGVITVLLLDAQPLNVINSQLERIINSFSSLATKDEIANMTAGINSLTQEVNCKTHIREASWFRAAAENNIAAVVEDVNALKQRSTGTGVSANDLISEINDVSNRARNLILYNVPESIQTILLKKEDDMAKLRRIFGVLEFENNPVTFYRLGKYADRKVRPPKIIFNS